MARISMRSPIPTLAENTAAPTGWFIDRSVRACSCLAEQPDVSSHYRLMYRFDTLRRCNEWPGQGGAEQEAVTWVVEVTSSSSPSSACSTSPPCMATNCANG